MLLLPVLESSVGRRIPRMDGCKAPVYLLPGEMRSSESLSISQCPSLSQVALAQGGGGGTAFAKGTAEVRQLPVCLGPCQCVPWRLGRGEQTRGFSDGLCGPSTLFSLGGRSSHDSKSWPGGAGQQKLEGRMAYVR